jgi:hypothetical protein
MKKVTCQLEESSLSIEIVDSGLDEQPEVIHLIGFWLE